MADLKPIRVLIADDHILVRSGLRLFLQAFDDLELVGEASSGEEAVHLCSQVEPDVVLMDLIMPGMGGVAAAEAIRQQCPQARVIALTNFQEGEMVQQALRAGVTGYLLKNVTADELARAIRAAKAGHPTLAPEATQALIQAATQSPAPPPEVPASLTPREREVLAWMITGLSNPEIAERLCVSRSTAKAHVSNILSKMGVSNRAEAISLALQYNPASEG